MNLLLHVTGYVPPIAEITEIISLPNQHREASQEDEEAEEEEDFDLSNGCVFSADGVDTLNTLNTQPSPGSSSTITGIESIVNRVSDLGLQGD